MIVVIVACMGSVVVVSCSVVVVSSMSVIVSSVEEPHRADSHSTQYNQ